MLSVVASLHVESGGFSHSIPAHGCSSHAPLTHWLVHVTSTWANWQFDGAQAVSFEVTRVLKSRQVLAGKTHFEAQLDMGVPASKLYLLGSSSRQPHRNMMATLALSEVMRPYWIVPFIPWPTVFPRTVVSTMTVALADGVVSVVATPVTVTEANNPRPQSPKSVL
jgi:hypothetical protein